MKNASLAPLLEALDSPIKHYRVQRRHTAIKDTDVIVCDRRKNCRTNKITIVETD